MLGGGHLLRRDALGLVLLILGGGSAQLEQQLGGLALHMAGAARGLVDEAIEDLIEDAGRELARSDRGEACSGGQLVEVSVTLALAQSLDLEQVVGYGRGIESAAAMIVWAVVSLDTGRTVETFRTRDEAAAMIAEVETDEPDLAELLRVEPLDLEIVPN